MDEKYDERYDEYANLDVENKDVLANLPQAEINNLVKEGRISPDDVPEEGTGSERDKRVYVDPDNLTQAEKNLLMENDQKTKVVKDQSPQGKAKTVTEKK